MEYQAEASRQAASDGDAAVARPMVEAGKLHNLAAAARTRTAPDPDATFRYGLGLIIAGLRARHAELVGNR